MLSRIITSLNHGAFFGLGSVVAASVVPKHKQASAVATMFMGLTIANIGGVPAATWLGETIGWRMSFLATAGLGVIAIASLWLSLPKGGAGEKPDVKRELSVLVRPQVLSALLTTVLGAGAMFTLYTYISPVLHSITHATSGFITLMLVLIGVGFSIGNYLGGKFADRSVSGTLKGFLLLLMVIMLAIPFLAQTQIGAAVSMVVWGAATFAVVPPLQMRVMRVAHEAPGLSSSVNIGAFNLGNALGAVAGGAVISGGLGYSFVPVMGAIVAGLALLVVFFSSRSRGEEAVVSQ
jgi:DHA1 family inner membrane transport protein